MTRAGRADRSLLQSVGLHALLILAVIGSWLWVRREPRPPVPLAIEATVVDERTLQRGGQTPAESQPQPPPPPDSAAAPASEAAPPDDVEGRRENDERAQREAEQLAAREAEQKLRLEAEQAEARVRRKEDERAREAAERAAEQKAAAERTRAEQQARERAAADARIRAERAAEDARIRAEREADLRRQLDQEQRAMDARSSGLANQWAAAIQARIQRAWIRPPSARAGLDCTVAVTQAPGGVVQSVRVLSCNGDETTRQSIEAAVYRASPLPPPPDPALFERELELRFRPND